MPIIFLQLQKMCFELLTSQTVRTNILNETKFSLAKQQQNMLLEQ